MDIEDVISSLCGECGQHKGVYQRLVAEGAIDSVCRECRDSMVKGPNRKKLDAASERALAEQKKMRKREARLKRERQKEE